MENISEHVSWEEFCGNSSTAREKGINNECTNEAYIMNAKLLAEKCFEPIRAHFGIPLIISSFYRSTELNKAVGGVADSQHQYGQAMDIEMGWEMNLKIMEWAKVNLDFDQLLNEYPDAEGRPTWVHISYVSPGKNRHEFIPIKK
jgi:zinc D-Ala-D-Ala carboxypeptidase